MAKALPVSCRLAVSERNLHPPPGPGGMVDFFFATSGNEALGNLQGGKEDLRLFIKCLR